MAYGGVVSEYIGYIVCDHVRPWEGLRAPCVCVHVSFSPLRGLQLNILFISHFDIFF